MDKMEKHWKYFLLLLWFSYLFISGLLLFTRGFLLKREVLAQRARCKTPFVCEKGKGTNSYLINSSLHNENLENQECLEDTHWTEAIKSVEDQLTCQSRRAKVILIVIDALKYDFVHFNTNFNEEAFPFQNRLTVINELLLKEPNHTRLFKFIADPPTTTMQRLKGLTTGSLPTFIDVGSNFATPEINEDNILDQLKAQNKNIVFMGDDTWSGLYPKRFIREYSYPSFNVWDLDTVDNGIMDHLLPEIVKKDWNFLIAHFLGVDHCGDHGGDSEAEVTAGMFVFSSKPLLSEDIIPHTDIVRQVDLVPTLSAILGLPIPFSNLGAVILETLPSFNEKNISSDWSFALKTLWQNIQQTMDYIKLYSDNTQQFSQEKLNLLQKNYTFLKDTIKSISSVEDFVNFSSQAKEYLTLVREMCEEVWVQFDSVLMFHGLILTFISVSFIFLLVDGIPGDELRKIVTGSFLATVFGCIALTTVGILICNVLELLDNLEIALYFSTGLVSIMIMFVVLFRNWFTILMHCLSQNNMSDWPNTAGRLLLLFSVCGLFSNSYIVEEARVLSYFILTMTWLLLYSYKPLKLEPTGREKKSEKQPWLTKNLLPPVKVKFIMFVILLSMLVRFSQYFWLCREEQVGCESFTSNKAHFFTSITNLRYCNSQCLFTLICLALFVTIVRIWLRSCGNLVGFSPIVMLSRYAPTLVVVCTGGYWVLQSLPKDTRNKLFMPWQVQMLPWIVYGVLAIALVTMFIQPLSIFRVPKKKESMTFPVYGQTNIIPHIFNQMKELMQGCKESGEGNDFPIVYGLATVYSSAFVNIGTFVCLFAALVLGVVLAPSVVLMCITGTVLLTLISAIQLHYFYFGRPQLFYVPWSSVMCWGFLAMYFFYGTGHNPTFPGIQWEAAFVGTGGQFSNHIVPALLIGVNTFTSHIVLSLMLPVLLITPFTLHVMFPKLVPSSNKDPIKCDDLKRGELILYEKEELLYHGTFVLCTKFILFFGIRVSISWYIICF
ncbi:GPI ethanolamine phosphate transferase 3 [Blattella germanica]|nr:GPI ethanolamine phosphate transferase 3 [Blattella germanica]